MKHFADILAKSMSDNLRKIAGMYMLHIYYIVSYHQEISIYVRIKGFHFAKFDLVIYKVDLNSIFIILHSVTYILTL